MSMLTRDKLLWSLLIVVGTYGSYALGANNVANATGIFSGRVPGVSDQELALVGGVAIAAGVITFSRRMMLTVGGRILTLDAFSALVAVLAMAVTVHVYALVGAPVSSGQAIVGAIIGVGFLRGVRNLRVSMVRNIGVGWFITPLAAMILSAAGYAIFCLPKN